MIYCLSGLLLFTLPAWAQQLVRVGVYQNSPKIAYTEAGQAEGIFIDLIEAIAEREGWRLEYVPGTWSEGLERLATGQLDLMPDVALTTEREDAFAFHNEPVLSSWHQIYARRDSGIRSLLDLEDRVVAVLEGSIQQQQFNSMVEGFGLNVQLQPYPDFEQAFQAVADNRADAVITNRFYGMRHAAALGLQDTAIIFSPSRLYYAAPRQGDPARLAAIDRHLLAFKADSGSIYYRSLQRWTGEAVQLRWPPWLGWAVLAAIALLLSAAAWVVVLRRQVAARTREIARRNDEISSINRTLRTTGASLDLPTVLNEALHGALALSGFDGGILCYRQSVDGALQLGARVDRQGREDPAEVVCPTQLEGLAQAGRYLLLSPERPVAGQECPIQLDKSIRWNAFFPLSVHGQVIGVLCLYTRQLAPPRQRKLDLVQELCVPVALAMENVHLYQQARQHAHELEQRVEERTAELLQANQQLSEAKYAAEAADRLKSAFLATMSHELRTPLNSIIGFTGILLQELAGPLNPEQHKQLGMVRDSARHLLAMINDVLDISKIEAGELALAEEVFDLRASIKKVMAIMQPLADKKSLSLSARLAEGVGEMRGDSRRVEQIMLNLLGNAVKFTENGGISLSVEGVEGIPDDTNGTPCPGLLLSVADTGIGIQPEDLQQLFIPFRQIDSKLSRQHEGTGLGLAICQRLIELMGGTIKAESRWGEGSCFRVFLPLRACSGESR